MPHESKLIALIAVGFVLALAFGFLAARVRLPPLVGYLVAGIAIGPFTPGFVADTNLASEVAEIGVILLMFGVGLHFSISTLLRVRAIALPGAVAQIAVATAIGAGLARWWGWSLSAGLVFGLALSVASTVVLLRALEQRNELDTQNGHIAVGWLIVEDLATVLALVFLPALATDGDTDASSLLLSLGTTAFKVAVFVALMLVGGRRIVPWILHQVARAGSRELFTLAVLAIALGIAYGSAHLFDVSFALGAFFAGVVLAETDLSHQAAENSLPLQDAFAVMFFVSVGMLFDPSVVLERPLELLGVLFIIVVGKSLAAFAIVLAFGYPVRTALTISASLAQIGEFSFILAGLGVGLGLLPPEGRDLILAGALLSITFNPFAFGMIKPMTSWLDRHPRVLALLERRNRRHAPAAPGAQAAGLRNHAVIVGYRPRRQRRRSRARSTGPAVRGGRDSSAHRRRPAHARYRRNPGRCFRRRRAGPRGGRAGTPAGDRVARWFSGTAHSRAGTRAQSAHRRRRAHAQLQRAGLSHSSGRGPCGNGRAGAGAGNDRLRAAQPRRRRGTLRSSSRSGCARRKSHGQSDSTSANSTNCAVW